MTKDHFRSNRIHIVAMAAVLALSVFAAACHSSEKPDTPTTEIQSTTVMETVDAVTQDTEIPSDTESPATQPNPETFTEWITEGSTEPASSEAETEDESETAAPEFVVEMLPMEGGSYVIGDPDSASVSANHYTLFLENHRLYLEQSFILYGTYMRQEEIPCISFGEDMYLPVGFDGVDAPAEGAYVKMTAVLTTPPPADDVPYTATYMMASAVEILTAPEVEEKIRYVIAERLAVRSTPDSGSDANKIAQLEKGTAVRLLEDSCGERGEWCKIAFDGEIGYGYVKAAYLSENAPQ